MPVSNKTFDSVGGFSIDKTTIVDNEKNAKDLNTLQIKNSFTQIVTHSLYTKRYQHIYSIYR